MKLYDFHLQVTLPSAFDNDTVFSSADDVNSSVEMTTVSSSSKASLSVSNPIRTAESSKDDIDASLSTAGVDAASSVSQCMSKDHNEKGRVKTGFCLLKLSYTAIVRRDKSSPDARRSILRR